MFGQINCVSVIVLQSILIVTFSVTWVDGEPQPIIKTETCVYRGTTEKVNGVTVFSWQGIRYGRPPVAELRFRSPVPFICKPDEDQAINATRPANVCPQVVSPSSLEPDGYRMRNGINMSEDCLQLSIWVPILDNDQMTKSHPYRTLVILPGGTFESNLLVDQNFDDGSILAARSGIIVATVHSRLGVLGFTYTDNPDAPGNQGLLDQSLALHWIKTNIGFFGGDPSLITVYGQGSSSLSSVIINILNSASESQFNTGQPLNRFVLSSGFPVPGSCDDKATAFQKFVWLTEELGCRPIDAYSIETRFMLSCLRSIPTEIILKGQMAINQRFQSMSSGLFSPTTKPTAGTENFPQCTFDPNDSSLTSFRGLNILMLNMEDEGSSYLMPNDLANSPAVAAAAASAPTGEDILNYFKFIDNQTMLYMGLTSQSLENVLPLYFAELLDGYEMGLQEALIQLIGDRLVYCPSLLSALSLASSGNLVHQGLVTYTSISNKYRETTGFTHSNLLDSTYGARTGLDYWLITGKPFTDPYSNDQDKWMSNELIHLISDFVKTEEIPWPPLLPLPSGRTAPFEYDLDVKNPYKPLRKSERYFDCNSWKPFIWPVSSPPPRVLLPGFSFTT